MYVPNRTSISGDHRNPHIRHHHHPPPPPPPRQLPPAPSYPSLPPAPPPPPPFNPHQSQFTFLNHHRQPLTGDFTLTHTNNNHQHFHSSPLPRVSTRVLFEDNHNLNRIRESNRPYPNHHHQPISPYLPTNSYNHDLDQERNFRYRNEHIDGYIGNIHNQQLLRDQNDRHKGDVALNNYHQDHRSLQYLPNSGRSRDFDSCNDSSSIISRDLPSGVKKIVGNQETYAPVVNDERLQSSGDEEWTWLHIGKKGNEVEATKELPSVSTRRASNVQALGKFNNRATEAREQFFGTQKKQIQKKSAFLRIGKPNHKNKSNDHFSKSHFDDSNTSSFRGKDKDPVEELLDVSFKSNSLVAKAVMNTSSPSVVANKNLSPRSNRILEKAEASPKTKFVRRMIKLDHLTNGSDSPSSSDKGPKHSPEKVNVSGNVSLYDIGSSLPSSSGTDDSAEITNFEIDPVNSQAEKGIPPPPNPEEPKIDKGMTSEFEIDTTNSQSEMCISPLPDKKEFEIDEGTISNFEIDAINSQGIGTASDDCLVDDSNNMSCLDQPALLLEADLVEVPPITKVFSDEDAPMVEKKRKFGDIEFGISSPSTSETPVNIVSSVVDREITTLSHSVKNLVSTEEEVSDSILVNSCIYPQMCNDDGGVSMGNVQTEGSTKDDISVRGGVSGGLDVISLKNNKKRKLSANHEKQIYEEKVDDIKPGQEKVDDMKPGQEKVDDMKPGQEKVDDIKPGQEKVDDIKPGQEMVDDIKQGQTKVVDIKPNQEKGTLPSKGIQSLSSTKRNIPNSAFPRVFTGQSSVVFSRKINPTNQNLKPRTWHRTDNPSVSLPPKKPDSSPAPPPKLSPRKFGKIQGSAYIRKGHSLVRKPNSSSSSVYRLNPSSVVESKRISIPESKDDGSHSASFLITGIERPKTPPLQNSTKLLDCETSSTTDFTVLPLENPPANGGSETTSDSLEYTENGADSANNGSQSVMNEAGKIRYVKRKANQLVAASNNGDLSVEDVDKTQAKSSEGYYKRRRKNQIVRTLTDSQTQINQVVPNFIPIRSSSKKQFGKGSTKMYKLSKFSPVWRLSNTQSSGRDISQRQKVWPNLFPWKRATYLRSFMQKSPPVFIDSSLSTISQKLLLSRKRDTVYTRSTHGFSLRISKLLSVGGSSLKWSKSIERNSKKANEEATLAVAAAEKKKRERSGAARKSAHSIKPRLGARIYRIGAVRYKMDPTKRTLQRISDEKESSSSSIQSEKDAKKPYIPRRLVIGNDEYVRLGNGNQLIRDPKKRTRTLASEKVRWSLHTARLRLAKKNTYCQFFTRFGTCNKHDDGKCPYIHDRSKIAVCTKFLNDSCSNPNCKLTHQVIPERMQDCSYFLQGICSNEKCPYRHVNVNSNASVCEGFLKGYCSDGNEIETLLTFILLDTWREMFLATKYRWSKLWSIHTVI